MIKVVFLLAYDYEFVKISLPLVYANADKILYSLDKNRVSWSGNKFNFDEKILDWISDYDTDYKIEIYEDDFYVPTNTSMQNDTRQRQMSADYLEKGGWTLMIDVDEYFIDFKGFVDFLNSKSDYLISPEETPLAVTANWINLFKQDSDGFYAITGTNFPIKIATNYPKYLGARSLKSYTVYTDFVMIHQSWARPEAEMKFKLENWSHNSEVLNADNYFEFWKGVNKSNYKEVRNFCNTNPVSNWKKLELYPFKTISELISYFTKLNYSIGTLYVIKKNVIQFFRKNKFVDYIICLMEHKV